MVFLDVFGEIEDPRDYTARHPLPEILFIAFAAILCGATHCTEMVFFAEARVDLLRQFIPLKHGVPSHDTFSRVLRALDPEPFNAAFTRFMAAFGAQARSDAPKGQIAVDGKSLRRAYPKGCAHVPPMVVTVFGCDTFMSLTQQLAQKGGEAEAAIAALELLSLQGMTVTADALHCHRRMTKAIRDKGGDYAIAIKGNQSKLATEANAALDAAAQSPSTRFHETEETAAWPPRAAPRLRRPLRPDPQQERARRPRRRRPRRKLAHHRRQDHPQAAMLRSLAQNVVQTAARRSTPPLGHRKQPPLATRRAARRRPRAKPQEQRSR